MYKNKARLEHEASENCDESFDMGKVSIPKIERRAHAVSSAYRSQVCSPIVVSTVLPHSGF
jgi:hypothetical protein